MGGSKVAEELMCDLDTSVAGGFAVRPAEARWP